MANEIELERILVRLVGENSQLVKTLRESTEQVKSFAQSAVAALGAIGLASSLKGAFESYSELEKAQIRLKHSVEAAGLAVGPTLDHYKALTKEITDSTTATKAEVYGLIEKGHNMGKTGVAIDNMVKTSLAFAAATGQGAESGFSLALALETGNTQMLKRALGMRFVKTESEILRVAQQRLRAGYLILEEQSDTASAKLEKLGRTFKAVSIEIGGMVAQGLQPLIAVGQKVVDWFNNLSPSTRQAITVISGLLMLIVSWKSIMFALAPVFAVVTGFFGTLVGVVGTLFSPMALLGIAVVMVKAAFAAVITVLGLLVSPFTWLIAIVTLIGGTLLVGFIAKGGSLGQMWDKIKEKAIACWEWTKTKVQKFITWVWPVWQAYRDFAIAAWDLLVEAATTAWDYIVLAANKGLAVLQDVWSAIGGGNVDFDDIKQAFMLFFAFAEFGLKNFGQLWAYGMAGVKLKFVSFADTVIFFFTDQLPAMLNWFGTEWKSIFTDAFSLVTTLCINQGNNQMQIFKNLFEWMQDAIPKAFSVFNKVFENLGINLKNVFQYIKDFPKMLKEGFRALELVDLGKGIEEQFAGLDITKGVKKLDEGFVRTTKELNIPERMVGPLEEQLRAEYAKLGGEVAVDFATFYAEKLKQWASEHPEETKKAGAKMMAPAIRGAVQEMTKLDFVQAHTANALAKLIDYTQMLTGTGNKNLGLATVAATVGANSARGTGGGAGANLPPPIAPMTAQENRTHDDLVTMTAILTAIRVAVEITARGGKQGPPIVPVGA